MSKEEKVRVIEAVIAQTLEEYQMLPEHGQVILGLSGGADSLCLAHYLYRRGIPFFAAHVNHGLRGEASDADEAFVREWCGRAGITLHVLKADVAAEARKNGAGLEECGREVRYRFFASLAAEEDRIATAHTLSDQTETVLYRLARGTGLRGLCGIPPVRGRIIRPLCRVSREEVETYCEHYALEYVTDASNFTREYARNRIRLDVIPGLKTVNPALEESVSRMVQSLTEDEIYLSTCAKEALERAEADGYYLADLLAQLPVPIKNRVVAQAVFRQSGRNMDAEHIRAVAAILGTGGAVSVPGGVNVRVEQGKLFVLCGNEASRLEKVPAGCVLTEVNQGRKAQIAIISAEDFQKQRKINNLLFNNSFDYDTITCEIYWRTRKEGDVFRPVGRGVTKSLKKLFQEAKIPAALRNEILVLEQGGEIIWMEGFGPAEGYQATPQSRRVALILIKEN